MTSKTSFCNKTLFGKTLRRSWPLWVGYLLIWLLILPVSLHTTLSSNYIEMSPVLRAQEYALGTASIGSPIMTFLVAPLSAMIAFAYLYSDKSCGVFAALPIRREASFGSMVLAGLLPLLLVPVVVFGVTVGVEASFGFVDWGSLLSWLGITLLHTLTFYGFAVLCAQFTGHVIVVPLVYGVLEFAASAVGLMVYGLLDTFLYGPTFRFEGNALSPLVQLFSHCQSQAVWVDGIEGPTAYYFEGWGTAAIYAGVGVVCLVLALLLYRRRRMETAGDIVAVKPLKTVFKYALGGGCALVMACLLIEVTNAYEGTRLVITTAIGLALGSFGGYFAAEMLMRKTFRVFKQCWKGFLILLGVLLVLLALLTLDVCKLETHFPAADQVEEVDLGAGSYYDAQLRDTENIEAAVEACRGLQAQKVSPDAPHRYVSMTFLMKDGSMQEFYYDRVPDWPDVPELGGQLEGLLNSSEAIRSRFPAAEDVSPEMFHAMDLSYPTDRDGERWDSLSLTAEQVRDLYLNCVLPDVADGTLGYAHLVDEEAFSATEYLQNDLWIELYQEKKPNERASYHPVRFVPNTGSLRTNAYLKEHGVRLILPTKTSVSYPDSVGYR